MTGGSGRKVRFDQTLIVLEDQIEWTQRVETVRAIFYGKPDGEGRRSG